MSLEVFDLEECNVLRWIILKINGKPCTVSQLAQMAYSPSSSIKLPEPMGDICDLSLSCKLHQPRLLLDQQIDPSGLAVEEIRYATLRGKVGEGDSF